jgi:hypothetical protein
LAEMLLFEAELKVVDPRITTQAAAVSLCNEFVVALRGMRKVGKAHAARLDTADPFDQGRTGKLLSPLAVSRRVGLRHVRAACGEGFTPGQQAWADIDRLYLLRLPCTLKMLVDLERY